MDNFKGILLYRTADNKPFPQQYIEMGSWSSNPDQREEIRAYRDDNTRALTRITAQGRKSIFSFATRNNLHLKDKIAIQNWFTEKEVNSTERKIQLTFWNEETNNFTPHEASGCAPIPPSHTHSDSHPHTIPTSDRRSPLPATHRHNSPPIAEPQGPSHTSPD